MGYDCLNAVSYYFNSVHCLVAMYATTEVKTLILCQNHKYVGKNYSRWSKSILLNSFPWFIKSFLFLCILSSFSNTVINLAGSVVTSTNLHLTFPRCRAQAVALLSREDGDRLVGAHGLHCVYCCSKAAGTSDPCSCGCSQRWDWNPQQSLTWNLEAELSYSSPLPWTE